ncbi:hypothetical protein L7F22_021429 [Adiantum nelumboides]|nr:hypothetical protein [Adiantum nelumboides]
MDFLVRIALGYFYPAYKCFKVIDCGKPKSEQLYMWCQYWIIIAVFTGYERMDSMLAVVCKTREAAGLLVRLNKSDGSINKTFRFYDYIKRQKRNIDGKLQIFIMEDMRLYTEGLKESDIQKLLKLDQPKLIDGSVPRGFLGYAVNFLQLNEEHNGLRGSMFYSLLKELQVYDTRRNLFSAKSALTV